MKSNWGRRTTGLPHIVQEALDALRPVPEPDPDVWQQMRAAYITEAHSGAELYQATHRDKSLAMAVTSPAIARRRGWSDIKSLLSFNPKEVSPMVLALKVMMVLALVFGGSAGTVSASRDSLPGSALYPVKVQLETWQMARAGTPEDTARTAMAQAQTRVGEATQLSEKGQAVPNEVANRFQQHVALALHASGDLEEPARARVRTEMAQMLGEQLQTMARVRAAQADGEDDDPVQAMVRTMEQTQALLGQDGDGGHGSGPGPGDGDGVPDQHGDGPSAGPGPGDGECDGDDCDGSGVGPGPGEGDGDGEPGAGPGPGDGECDGDDCDSNGPGAGPGDGDGEPNPGAGPGPGAGDGDGVCDGDDCDGSGPGAGPGPGDGNDDSGPGAGPGPGPDPDPDPDPTAEPNPGPGPGPGDGTGDGESYGPGPGDGECTGDCEPDQERAGDGTGEGDGQSYGPGPGDGECTGECEPDGSRTGDGPASDDSGGGRP